MGEQLEPAITRPLSGRPAQRPERVKLSTVLLALMFTALMRYGDYLGRFLDNTWFGGFHFSIGPFLVLLGFVLGINVILRKISPRRAFSSAQLVAIWILTIVPFGTMTGYLVPNMAAYHYYASPENNWDELFAEEIAGSLLVQDARAVEGFFEGSPPGQPVPWAAWRAPMVTWGIFAFASYAMMLGLAVILRRRWVEEERFTFPLVQVITDVAASPPPGKLLNAFLRNGMVWIAAGAVFILHSMRALHNFYPAVPTYAVRHSYPLTELPWSHAGTILIAFVPMMIGLSYVLTLEVSFSLWFFHLLYKAQMIVMGLLGLPNERTGALYGGTKWANLEKAGGTIALAVWFFWLGRRHFTNVLRKAFSAGRSSEDADEPLTYRTSVLLFVIGAAVMIVWLGYFGGSWMLALLNVAIGIAVFVTIAWAIAQGGLFYVLANFSGTEVLTHLTGADYWRTRALVINMWHEQVFRLDLGEYLLPYLLNGFKICDSANLDKASVVRGSTTPFLLAYAIAMVTEVGLRYAHGGLLVPNRVNRWLVVTAQAPFRWVSSLRAFPSAFQLMHLGHFVLGAGFTLALAWMRIHFSWFPFHPIGFVLASGFQAEVLWLSLFIGWIIKAAAMRWGGYRVYQRLRPFFFGLIIGEAMAAGFWNAVSYITGVGYSALTF